MINVNFNQSGWEILALFMGYQIAWIGESDSAMLEPQ